MSVFAEHKKRWDKGQHPDEQSRIEVHGVTIPVNIFKGKDIPLKAEHNPETNKVDVTLCDTLP